MSRSLECVCIIDDDNIYINLVSKIIELKKLANTILVFKNGKQALDFFMDSISKDKTPQVIFLDLNMPIMDGWEFLEEFSKIKSALANDILLYVVSSSINNSDIKRAKSIEIVDGYLTKPIKLDDFEKILQ